MFKSHSYNASRAAGGTGRCLPVAFLSIDRQPHKPCKAKGASRRRAAALPAVSRETRSRRSCVPRSSLRSRLSPCPRARPPSIAPELSRDRQQTQAESGHRLLHVTPVPRPPQGRARTQRCGAPGGGRGGTPFSICRRRWLLSRQVAVRCPRFSANASRAAGGTGRCLPVAALMTIQHRPA